MTVPWQAVAVSAVARMILAAAGDPTGRPRIVAVDGHGGAGKSTAAALLAAEVPGAVVVHTDDVAWHHSFFGWSGLMIDGVLAPLHRGSPVSYRPPAWDARDRRGAITVPAGCPLVLVEGTGAARRELAPLLDAVVWIEADLAEAERRCLTRDGDTPEHRAFWDEWMAEEIPFFADHRPWERADVILHGTSGIPHDPARELVVRRHP